MPDCVKADGLSIVCTGPESCGKSTLAAALADELGLPRVDEVARDWLNARGGIYTCPDLDLIAVAQHEAELAAREADVTQAPDTARVESANTNNTPVAVVDTDITVIAIWAEERFGQVSPRLQELLCSVPPRLYVLCSPDIPWQADPLRENPHDRERLFVAYGQLLESLPWPVVTVSGSVQQRLLRVRETLQLMAPG